MDFAHRLTQNTRTTVLPSDNCRAVAELKSHLSALKKNMAHYNSVFSICANSTSRKYGVPDMEYFENLVRLPDI